MLELPPPLRHSPLDRVAARYEMKEVGTHPQRELPVKQEVVAPQKPEISGGLTTRGFDDEVVRNGPPSGGIFQNGPRPHQADEHAVLAANGLSGNAVGCHFVAGVEIMPKSLRQLARHARSVRTGIHERWDDDPLSWFMRVVNLDENERFGVAPAKG